MSHVNCSQARQIALVDCNNFFPSCERIFHPAWAKRPLVVLTHNDGRIIARSNEVKALGIPMGIPYFQAKHLLKQHDAVIVSGNHCLYNDISARVMQVLQTFTQQLEIYSIDEAFLDLTGKRTSSLTAYAHRIVRRVRKWTGIPVSIGIGPTKVLAKIAVHIVKHDPTHPEVLNFSSVAEPDPLLATVGVGDIWGIGRQTSKRLQNMGIYNARQLKNAEPTAIRSQFGTPLQQIVAELQGVFCLPFEETKAKKQLIVSRSFGRKVKEKRHLAEALATHAAKAAERLRNQKSLAGTLIASIATSPHSTHQSYLPLACAVQLPTPTADTMKLIAAAHQGLDKIFKPGYLYAKAGVTLENIQADGSDQQQLFNTSDSNKTSTLMATVDQLNTIHGLGTIRSASEGFQQIWQMRSNFRTNLDTTNWDTLPTVT